MKVYMLFHYRQPTFCRGVICDSHEWASGKLQHTETVDWFNIGKLIMPMWAISWLRVCNFNWLTNGYCGPYLAAILCIDRRTRMAEFAFLQFGNAAADWMPDIEHSLDNCSYFRHQINRNDIVSACTIIRNINTSSKRFRDCTHWRSAKSERLKVPMWRVSCCFRPLGVESLSGALLGSRSCAAQDSILSRYISFFFTASRTFESTQSEILRLLWAWTDTNERCGCLCLCLR